LPPPEIGPDIDRVIPYVHYRYRGRYFESFFNRLTLLQDETPPVTKRANTREKPVLKGFAHDPSEFHRGERADTSAVSGPRHSSFRATPVAPGPRRCGLCGLFTGLLQ
jgi:hypothetical protein